MVHHHHHSHFFLILLLQLIVTVANSFNTTNSTVPRCPSFDCGNGVKIEYPFWVPLPTTTNTTTSDTMPYFCGYPDLKITCEGTVPTFGPVTDNFIVTDIDFQRRAFFLVDSDVIRNHTCPIVRRVLNTTDTAVLDYTTEVVNLTFFYNCSYDPLFSSNRAPCLDNKNKNLASYVFVGTVSEENFTRLSGLCNGGSAVSPVLELALRLENIAQAFGNVMKSGFVLEWQRLKSDNCEECESSGGYCGYWNKTGSGSGPAFACFCKDGLLHSGSCDHGGTGLSTTKKVLIAVCSILGFIFVVALVYLFVRRMKNKKRVNSSRATLLRSISSEPSAFNKDPESQSMNSNYLTHIFSYKELEDATDGFSSSRELGDGGFGAVYKGSLRDGRTVAVKRLYENNYKRLEQFMNEVAIVNRLRHPSLVSLYGCTSRHSRELLLVYEYVPNGTVADHLHGSRAAERALTWSGRMNIAIETASVLAYLHANEPQIIHRDVKTNNILLDNSYHVKVADFGLSREFPLDATHVSTAPQGTPGYVDPEYHQCYQLTDKSDVYSFGVVLVELISSKPAVDITRRRQEINLSNMAINKIRDGVIHELADPEHGYDADPEVKRMIDAMAEVAFVCLQAEKDARPAMKDVKAMLINIVHGDGNEKQQMKDDAYLLNSDVPPSPNTVTMKWYSTTTTPNTSA